MSPDAACPYQIVTDSGRMKCFDSRLVAGIERPARIVEKFCRGNFLACPFYRSFEGMRSEGIFTPPSLAGTILLPGYGGGINWGGIAFEPESQVAVVFSMDLPMDVALIPRDVLGDIEVIAKAIDDLDVGPEILE